jgi:sirohydrochlorin cobaltochelatase
MKEVPYMKKLLVLLPLAALIAVNGIAFAHGPERKPESRKAILIVSFGTSLSEARHAIDALVEEARRAFPGEEIRLAYTSNTIRRKIAEEERLFIPSPPEALAKLQDEGFTHVYVQPTHIIPGKELDDIDRVVTALASIKGKYGFEKIVLGQPLLAGDDDCADLAAALYRTYRDRIGDDRAVVFMGHGSPHGANAFYSQMQLALEKVSDRFFLGTVEAFPSFDDMADRLGKSGARRVTLVPLMIVAGDHARNDMADADDPQSWLSLLKEKGFRVQAVLDGLGENDEIRALFLRHLKALVN